jgi:predicted alpha/beta-hydrolase family hydrolase
MYQITTLSKNNFSINVPNTFFRQETETNHLTMIFPGLNYSCDMPLLYYAAQIILEAGADVLQVKYDYTQAQPSGKVSPLSDRFGSLAEDVILITRIALEQREYKQLTVIGKSLGTLAIPILLQADLSLHPQTCIYLTPILQELVPPHDLIQTCPRNLFVIGTKDRYYDPELIKGFRTSQPDNFMIIEGVNHSLEFP